MMGVLEEEGIDCISLEATIPVQVSTLERGRPLICEGCSCSALNFPEVKR